MSYNAAAKFFQWFHMALKIKFKFQTITYMTWFLPCFANVVSDFVLLCTLQPHWPSFYSTSNQFFLRTFTLALTVSCQQVLSHITFSAESSSLSESLILVSVWCWLLWKFIHIFFAYLFLSSPSRSLSSLIRPLNPLLMKNSFNICWIYECVNEWIKLPGPNW